LLLFAAAVLCGRKSVKLDALVVLFGLASSVQSGAIQLEATPSGHLNAPLSRADLHAEQPPQLHVVADRGPGQDGLARDIVFVIDTTRSMAEALPPLKEAISEFLAGVRSSVDPRRKNGPSRLRTGLLFYQDRKIGSECRLDYITQWQVPLSADAGPETVGKTIAALNAARTTTCGSDEEEEAVYDAVVQAITHPRWQDGAYRLLALIGDAGPHPPQDGKNPMKYDQADILKLADQHNIHILAVQIKRDPYQDVSAFQQLSTGRRDDLKGSFVAVSSNPKAIRDAVGRALRAELNGLAR
jgi:hypothetical protein